MRTAPGIEAYGGGGFRVAGERHDGSILILNDEVRVWPVATVADVTPETLTAVLAVDAGVVEFLLLGVGPKLSPAPRALRDAMQAAGLGLEVMNTMEACRLYNLMAEDGRRIAAALIAV